MRLTVARHRALEARYGIRLRVLFHETDVTDECVEADDRAGWWKHWCSAPGMRWPRLPLERARLHGPVRFIAKAGRTGRWDLWWWRLMGQWIERGRVANTAL